MSPPTLHVIRGGREQLLDRTRYLLMRFVVHKDREALRELTRVDAHLARRPRLRLVSSSERH